MEKILIVDDSILQAAQLKAILADEYDVTVVQTAEECFCNGADYVYYTDYEDLMEKVEYYLSHEKERKEIARNGYENVKKNHTYRNRVDAIMEIINEGERNFAG